MDETSERAEGLSEVTDRVVRQAEELSGFPFQIVPHEDLKVLSAVAISGRDRKNVTMTPELGILLRNRINRLDSE